MLDMRTIRTRYGLTHDTFNIDMAFVFSRANSIRIEWACG